MFLGRGFLGGQSPLLRPPSFVAGWSACCAAGALPRQQQQLLAVLARAAVAHLSAAGRQGAMPWNLSRLPCPAPSCHARCAPRCRGSWVQEELFLARNLHPAFTAGGLWGGLAYSAVDTYLLRGKAPWTFKPRCVCGGGGGAAGLLAGRLHGWLAWRPSSSQGHALVIALQLSKKASGRPPAHPPARPPALLSLPCMHACQLTAHVFVRFHAKSLCSAHATC